MKTRIINIFTIAVLLLTGLTAAATADAQNTPYRVSDRTVQYLLNRIESRTDTYKRDLNRALDSSRLNGSDTEDMVTNYVTDFENATDALKQKFDGKNTVSADVEDVLNRAAYINQFMKTNRLNVTAQRSWTNIRTDLTTLARYYSINGDWTNPSNVSTTVNNPYRVNDTTVSRLLTRIEQNTDFYKRDLNTALDRSRLNNTDTEDTVLKYITEFENATDSLKQRFDARRSANTDVNEVLNRAYYIDNFMRENRLDTISQRRWSTLRTDLETLSNYYNVSFNWNNAPATNNNVGNTTGRLPYRVSDTNVRSLLTRIEQRTDTYKRNMNTALDRSVLNNTRSEEALYSYITDFEKSTDALKQNFDARRSTAADVEEVLNRAYFINGFMRDYRFTASAESDWNLLRTDLSMLSDYYSVNFDFNNRQFSPVSKFDSMLTGTYRLNVAQSDNVSEVVGRTISSYYRTGQQDRIQTALERRLTSPEMLAIEKRDKQVTVGSSTSPQITFTADNVARTENTNNGRSIKITANTNYDGVSLNYEGDRINDFYVNFIPLSNGQLKVVRRVYLENRNETVTVASIYDKVNDTAQFYNLNNGGNSGSQNTAFVVPNNTQIMAKLLNPISTKATQEGDRFTMQVSSPSQYDGAVIEGHISKAERSGQVSGRANVSMEFDTIRLRNGQTYSFAGIIDSVKLASGENVTVNNEGTVRDNNQTTKTVQRAGIGAAIGALIGAIAGGGQGAAIGAAVGAGAGAGTVILQGRDDIELDQGSEFTITATAPANANRQ